MKQYNLNLTFPRGDKWIFKKKRGGGWVSLCECAHSSSIVLIKNTLIQKLFIYTVGKKTEEAKVWVNEVESLR